MLALAGGLCEDSLVSLCHSLTFFEIFTENDLVKLNKKIFFNLPTDMCLVQEKCKSKLLFKANNFFSKLLISIKGMKIKLRITRKNM